MSHIMIDLETLNTTPDSAILSIGAVRFDCTAIRSKYYQNVDRQSSFDAGLTVSEETTAWWAKQSAEARASFSTDVVPLEQALVRFAKWLPKGSIVWGNGAAFDNIILANAYHVCGMEAPWKFWNDRCYRTIRALYSDIDEALFKGVPHNALHDAAHQAEHLIKMLKENHQQL